MSQFYRPAFHRYFTGLAKLHYVFATYFMVLKGENLRLNLSSTTPVARRSCLTRLSETEFGRTSDISGVPQKSSKVNSSAVCRPAKCTQIFQTSSFNSYSAICITFSILHVVIMGGGITREHSRAVFTTASATDLPPQPRCLACWIHRWK